MTLQFETAIATEPAAAPGVTCAGCRRLVTDEYYDINGTSFCGACRGQVLQQASTPREWTVLVRALAFGVGAAFAGAALYFAVLTLAGLEIGLVAIAIGYMVGFAVGKATGGRGGRRFQLLAVFLTYWAVGLAYTPVVLSQLTAEDKEKSAAEQVETVDPGSPSIRGAAVLAGLLIGFSVAMPVLIVAGSLPSGLITAAIIAFGMQQAWRMTAPAMLQVQGPYRIGAAPPAPA
jgi:hypothetical protein